MEKLISATENLVENEETLCLREEISKAAIKSLNDPYERCRELGCQLFLLFLKHFETEETKKVFPFLFQILSRKLSIEDEYEPSEEVRMKMMELIAFILDTFSKCMTVYADDVVDIILQTLQDDCPSIKRMSGENLSKLKNNHKRSLKKKGLNLVGPLAKCLTHRQHGVRVAAVQAMGDLVLSTDGGVFENVVSHIAQRTFDPSPHVRKQVALVTGAWLLDFPDRYSYFYKIVPLLIVSLEEEVLDIKDNAAKLWDEGGWKWLEENKMSDKRLKDEYDYLTEDPLHYPDWIERPNLGCRTLVARSQHQIYPSIGNDLKDWVVETRLKAVQLLYTVLYHSEQDIVMHTEKIFNCINTASKDEDELVNEYARKSSIIVGYMLQPKVWTPFMLERLKEEPSKNHLLILGGLIKGSEKEKIKSNIKEIVCGIADNSVCFSLEEDHQEELLQCLEAVLDTCKDDSKHVMADLFILSLAVISLSGNEMRRERARACQEKIMEFATIESLEMLYKNNIQNIFQTFLGSSPTWSSVSYEKHMFEAILHECGVVAGHFPDMVVTIFRNILSNENDPESRLQSFILLSKMLLNTSSTLDSQGTFSPYLLSVVKDIITPALKWKAGRTASAIRTAAASSLWSSLVAASTLSDDLLHIFTGVSVY